MKFYIIRHAKVNMRWPKKCTSDEFNQACKKYDEADIVAFQGSLELPVSNIYTSELIRTKQTAQQLFPLQSYQIDKRLNEVPLKAAFSSKIKLPLIFWNILGRLQWLFNSSKQEGIKASKERAEKFCDDLIYKGEDAILITHGFFMITLLKELKKRGFIVKDNGFNFDNLQVIEVKKRLLVY